MVYTSELQELLENESGLVVSNYFLDYIFSNVDEDNLSVLPTGQLIDILKNRTDINNKDITNFIFEHLDERYIIDFAENLCFSDNEKMQMLDAIDLDVSMAVEFIEDNSILLSKKDIKKMFEIIEDNSDFYNEKIKPKSLNDIEKIEILQKLYKHLSVFDLMNIQKQYNL